MNKGKKVALGTLIIILIVIALGLGYLGYAPTVAKVFGWDAPRDLGVTYSEVDYSAARNKSQLEYEALPEGASAKNSLVRTGSRPVNTSFTSAEITSLMNDRPYKYWPYKNVQMKFNADGSAEVSGVLIKDRISGYAAAIGVSEDVSSRVVKFLPPEPVFYVKCKAALSENKVSLLEPSVVEVGRLNIPISWILSFNNSNIAYAQDLGAVQDELSQYSGKKAIIIQYINSHLSGISGFYGKKANFSENALNFDGNLNEKEMTSR